MQRGQNLHTLDRIHAQVRIQRHAQIEHLRRVARLLGDDAQQDLLDVLRLNPPNWSWWCRNRQVVGHDRSRDRSDHRDVAGFKRDRGVLGLAAQERDDVVERVKRSQVFRFDDGRVRELFLQRGQNLHTLD